MFIVRKRRRTEPPSRYYFFALFYACISRLHRFWDTTVPEEKIISRYEKSLRNISKLIRIADHTRIIDNSGDLPALICEINGESVTIVENEFWTKQDILSLL